MNRPVWEAILRAPRLARAATAASAFARRSTPRRLFNLCLVEAEYRLRRVRLRGRPYVLVVDPLNVCNLRCPLCPTGRLEQGRPNALMSWDDYVRVVDDLAPWAYKINLFNWGEPLMHPHIFDMIRHARSRNLTTCMSSNLSLSMSDAQVEELVESGLEFLSVSIDGATQDVYAHYRQRGDLALVLANLERVVRCRRERGARFPRIEWQFIPMRDNAHEEVYARQLATALGCDSFRTVPVGTPFAHPDTPALAREWYPAGRSTEPEPASTHACYFLYRYVVVNPDMRVAPCCKVYGVHSDFGDVSRARIGDVWNNEMYRSARAHYRRNAAIEQATVCDSCSVFKKRSARKSYPTRH